MDGATREEAQTFARAITSIIQAPVTMLFGGSRMIGEAGPYSDDDWYVLVPNFFSVWRLRRQITAIREQKQALGITAQCIVVTPFLMRQGIVSLYAENAGGVVYESVTDPKFLATNFLKVACEFWMKSNIPGDRVGYYLGKSVLYTLASLALLEGWPGADRHPLVSIKKLGVALALHPEIPHIDQLARIMQYKSTGGPVGPDDGQVMREFLTQVVERTLRTPLSLHSQIVSLLVAPDTLRHRFINHDKKVLRAWTQAMHTKNVQAVLELSRFTAYGYIF